jgi:hypothetical protein
MSFSRGIYLLFIWENLDVYTFGSEIPSLTEEPEFTAIALQKLCKGA